MVSAVATDDPQTAPNRAEAKDRGDRQRATRAAQGHVAGAEEVRRQPGDGGDRAHQREQGHDGEGVGRGHLDGQRSQHEMGAGEAVGGRVAEEADEAERDGDRHPREDEQDQARDAGDREDKRRHVRASAVPPAASRTMAPAQQARTEAENENRIRP